MDNVILMKDRFQIQECKYIYWEQVKIQIFI